MRVASVIKWNIETFQFNNLFEQITESFVPVVSHWWQSDLNDYPPLVYLVTNIPPHKDIKLCNRGEIVN